MENSDRRGGPGKYLVSKYTPVDNSIRVTMGHGLPFPFPEDLPNLGIEPWSPAL